MGLIDKIKAVFAEHEGEEMNFIDVKTVDGRIMRVADLAVDQPVVEISEDGEQAVEDGEYELEDGTKLRVENGVIAEIMPAATEDETGEVVTDEMESNKDKVEGDNAELFMDVTLKDGPIAHIVTATEGEIKSGDRMMIDQTEAGPGQYETTNGHTVTVGEAGVIESVTTADEKVETDKAIAEAEQAVAEAEAEAEADKENDEEVQGVINNLKNLVKQIKDLKSQFEEVKSEVTKLKEENTELKGEVSKFAGAPSAEPTKTKVDFKDASKEDKLKFFAKR